MEINEDRELQCAAEKLFYKGKTGFARLLDRVLFSFSLGAGLYLLLCSGFTGINAAKTGKGKCLFTAMAFMGAVYILLYLIDKKRLERFSIALLENTRLELIKLRILLLDESAVFSLLSKLLKRDISDDNTRFVILRQISPVDEDGLIHALRGCDTIINGELLIFSVSGFTQAASEFADRFKSLRLASLDDHDYSDLIQIKHPELKDEIIRKAAFACNQLKPKKRKLIHPVEAKYVLTGFLLLALSFFMRSKLYMRLFGGAMISASVWVGSFRKLTRKPKEN